MMKTSGRVTKRQRSLKEKVAHLAKRIYRLGYENMRAQTGPCGFCGPMSAQERNAMFARLARTDTERSILTKRLQNLIGRSQAV